MFCHWKIHLTGEDGKLILRKKVTVRPVSYTHLDVYKRQAAEGMENIAKPESADAK